MNKIKETSDQTIKQLRFLGSLMINHAFKSYEFLPSIYRRSVYDDLALEADIKLKNNTAPTTKV